MRLLISTLHFTQALRLVPAKAFARANVPLRLVMTTGETAASAAAASARPLAGPWRRTMYELYDWVSLLGAEGSVQKELVERATLEQQPCLGVALSSVAEEDDWPRDDFLTGATLEFSFGPPPLGPLSRPALELDENTCVIRLELFTILILAREQCDDECREFGFTIMVAEHPVGDVIQLESHGDISFKVCDDGKPRVIMRRCCRKTRVTVEVVRDKA